MSSFKNTEFRSECRCGQVATVGYGKPIVVAACYCSDCQAGARQIEALSDAGPVADADGGTEYILFRKDRFAIARGNDLLESYKLEESSATSRMVASCCNSAMFLRFDDRRHWVSAHRARLAGSAPPVELRICTRSAPASAALLAEGSPHKGIPLLFIVRLVKAQLAMLLTRRAELSAAG